MSLVRNTQPREILRWFQKDRDPVNGYVPRKQGVLTIANPIIPVQGAIFAFLGTSTLGRVDYNCGVPNIPRAARQPRLPAEPKQP
jgi:hypothetical protein